MNNVQQIYNKLRTKFGPQHWWPAETPFEVVVGAVLVQNTAWSNVSKVIAELKSANLLSLKKLLAMNHDTLAGHLHGTGYFNVKARRLRSVLEFLDASCGEDLTAFQSRDVKTLRSELLEVNGVGRETADSIILYAVGLPIFVIDAYTFRVWERLGYLNGDETYDDLQKVFEDNLPRDVHVYGEYHGLFVRLCKEHCTKNKPLCATCPLKGSGQWSVASGQKN
ncbi:MAG: endonuclease III domain-containing protein [Thermoguttaceae bacterium]